MTITKEFLQKISAGFNDRLIYSQLPDLPPRLLGPVGTLCGHAIRMLAVPELPADFSARTEEILVRIAKNGGLDWSPEMTNAGYAVRAVCKVITQAAEETGVDLEKYMGRPKQKMDNRPYRFDCIT
jgi:hypothetical protein